jgi:membrane-bound lytic murein transglycosylase D
LLNIGQPHIDGGRRPSGGWEKSLQIAGKQSSTHRPSDRARFAAAAAVFLLITGCASIAPPEDPASQAPARVVTLTTPPAATPPVAGQAPAMVSASPPAALPAQTTVEPLKAATPGGAAEVVAPQWIGRDQAGDPGSLWDRIRAGFAMPELNTPLVGQKERFYLSRPDLLQSMFDRGGRYLFHIVEEIEKRGMPTELALLPYVESAMDPTALSSARAAGLWQFIPSTGKAYNLDQNWWVDNRRDVVKSTGAALDYLQTIYQMHGNDWFLALASYNWGENAVARAIRTNKARGLPTDYLSLRMPNETRHYIPKLIALKHIVQNAEAMGVRLPDLPNRPYFVTLEKTGPIDLKLAARFANMSVEEFVALNPAHNRPVISASRNNLIKLPADRLDGFLDAVERHGNANLAFATWQPYTLKSGESLESIARRAGIPVAELRDANDLRRSGTILAGTRILVPMGKVDDESRVESFAGPRVYELVNQPAAYHRVARRDTLATIARRYGTTVAELRKLNNLSKDSVAVGTNLMVRPARTQTQLTLENGDRRILAQNDPAAVRARAAAEAAQSSQQSARQSPPPQSTPKSTR